MTSASGKYTIQDPLVDEEHGVLKNMSGITDQETLDLVETRNLAEAYETAAATFDKDHRFTEEDVRLLHKLFLGAIYEWAGTYRLVDISSPGIRYCHAAYIPENMHALAGKLAQLTPFDDNLSKDELVKRIAEIHGELIIIHPFRDGNGRTTRLLCDLLLMQAGHQPIATEVFYDKSFIEKYHRAIKDVWSRGDYSGLAFLLAPLIS